MTQDQDTQATCPVCRSPLVPDAIRQGKCQCCGAELEAQEPEEEPASE